MSEGLLRTKLFAPPARPHQIRRQRLLDKLNAGLQAGIPFTLISNSGRVWENDADRRLVKK